MVSVDSYRAWWDAANAQLDKISPNRNHPVRTCIELFLSELYLRSFDTPKLRVILSDTTDIEIVGLTLEWEKYNKDAFVSVDGNFDCKILFERVTSPLDLPLTNEEYNVFESWIYEGIARKPPVNHNDFLNVMLGSITKIMGMEDELKNEPSNDKEKEKENEIMNIKLDAMGEFFQTLTIAFISLLRWLVSKLNDRVPVRGILKSLTVDTLNDVKQGYWNDVFSSPDHWLMERNQTLFEYNDRIFRFFNFMIRNKTLTLSTIAFLAGYSLA
jgi:hypothetical protein